MKRMLILFFSGFMIFITSCEENFSPKGEFQEKYILYCVQPVTLDMYPISPVVFITKTYDSDSNTPSSEKHAPIFVEGAKVILKVGEFVDTLQRMTRYNCYGGVDSKFSWHQEVDITAILPDSTILSTSANIPVYPLFELSYPFKTGLTTKLNQFLWGKTWKITWDKYDGFIFFPKFYLHYYQISDSTTTHNKVEIPMFYTKDGDKSIPVYPTYTRDNFFEVSYDAIDSTMQNISVGDTSKSSYSIWKYSLELVLYDSHLSNFYSSTNGYLDPYSIRLDESVYSNVSGGMGVFGFYIVAGTGRTVNKEYAESFGYKKYGD